MPRPKSGKEWERASYALDRETKENIKEIAGFENMSQSELISFLVKNWDAGINPSNKLGMLIDDRKKLKIQVDKLDQEIEVITKQIKIFEEWRKQKSKKKSQAVEILKTRILSKEFEEAERLSKTWQRMTGIPAIELISEATQQIKESGI